MSHSYLADKFTITLFCLCLICHVSAKLGINFTQTRIKRWIILPYTPTTIERVTHEGYPLEIHKIQSPDGYILGIHRIPYGRKDKKCRFSKKAKRPAIILMHGLMGSSIDWLQNYPERALGFMLADLGYDVWIPNIRGNKYSRQHVSLSDTEREFWMFGWEEIALYDLPTIIDHALFESNTNQLSYVGYSLGCTVLAAMLSEKPEYNRKIKVAAFLGPAIYMTHSNGALVRFSSFSKPLEKIFDLFKIWEIDPQNEFFKLISTTLCSLQNQFLNRFCYRLYSKFIIEINGELINKEFLPYILSNLPAGLSVKSGIHYWQVKNADRFQKYDYGRRGNLKAYGQSNPPLFHINKTTIPIGIFTASGDNYATKKDTIRLAKEIPNLAYSYELRHECFSHFNFLWSSDATHIMYKQIIYFLHKYL